MRQRWNKWRVVECIKQQRILGQQLNAWHVVCHNLPLLRAGVRYFGSWKNAIRAAGIRYQEVRRKPGRESWKWNRDIVVAQIQQMHQAGELLNSNYIQKHNLNLFAAARKYCGGWGEAVLASGIDYGQIRKYRPRRRWTKEMVVRAIRARKRVGLGLNRTVMGIDDYGLTRAARIFFGKNGWRKALTAAGIDPVDVMDPRRVWSKKKVIAEIQRRWQQKVPLYAFHLYRTGHAGILTAGIRFYGSWRKTIEASGLDYEEVRACKRGWWSKRRIIAEIRRLVQSGTRLNTTAIEEIRGDLAAAGRVYFGSWQRAIEAAGFNYRQHSKIWSTKAWLRTLTPAHVKALEKRALKLAETRRRLT